MMNTQKTIDKVISRREKESRHISVDWMLFVTLFFVALDGIAIYQLTEVVMMQRQWLSIFSAVAVAVLLDGIPYALPTLLQKKSKSPGQIALILLLTLGFLGLMATLGCWRWSARELMFESTSGASGGLILSGMQERSAAYEPTECDNMTSWFWTLLPLFSSIFVFGLSFMKSAKEKEEIMQEKKRIRLGHMNAQNDRILVERMQEIQRRIDELRYRGRNDLYEDDQQEFTIMERKLDHEAETMKNEVRRMLACRIGSPDMVSKLLES